MFNIQLMSKEYAKEICQWQYDGIYSLYNLNEDDIDELLNGQYYSCTKDNSLIGFFCFGKSAQIPTIEDKTYEENALDIGLGLKPELCGKGLGKEFLKAGIQFSKAKTLRLSVAQFNQRACHLYQTVGFSKMKEVSHLHSQKPFDIMIMTIKNSLD